MRLFRHLALWVIISITIPTFALGQKTKEPYGAPPTLTDRELKKEALNHDCKARDKFTFSERLGFYPFNTGCIENKNEHITTPIQKFTEHRKQHNVLTQTLNYSISIQ